MIVSGVDKELRSSAQLFPLRFSWFPHNDISILSESLPPPLLAAAAVLQTTLSVCTCEYQGDWMSSNADGLVGLTCLLFSITDAHRSEQYSVVFGVTKELWFIAQLYPLGFSWFSWQASYEYTRTRWEFHDFTPGIYVWMPESLTPPQLAAVF